MPRNLRVFLDTSAILAGLNSPTGAAGAVLAACFARKFTPVISPQVIEESERNILSKFPKLETSWASFLLIPPEITPSPSLRDIRRAYKIIRTSDAPILASAIQGKVDAVVTWDMDFLRGEIRRSVKFPIFLPGEFIQNFLPNKTS